MLSAGEALRVAGANGSGKTSLLRILCGLLGPSEGRILWRGEEVGRLREDYSRELVYLGHAPSVKDDLSPAENLSIACRVAGEAASHARVQAALDRFGLRGVAAPARRLSQGQRRRTALARLALSEARPLWLLDEPFSALDAAGVAVLNGLLADHTARGGALVFTTHQETEIAAKHVIELG